MVLKKQTVISVVTERVSKKPALINPVQEWVSKNHPWSSLCQTDLKKINTHQRCFRNLQKRLTLIIVVSKCVLRNRRRFRMVLKETSADHRGFRKYYNKPALISGVSEWFWKNKRWSALLLIVIKEINADQRCFRIPPKQRALIIAASEWVWKKEFSSALFQKRLKERTVISPVSE